MGKVKVIIQLADQRPAYYAGQTVQGKIILDIKDELKVSAVNIKFRGFAHVQWKETEGSGNNRRTVTYTATETYCNFKQNLLDMGGEKDKKLHAGQFEFPFSVQIPSGAPSSYEAFIGQVRYMLKAHVDRPWAFDSYAKHAITVCNLLDLNTLPNLCVPKDATDQKHLCCCCCKSDPIVGTIRIHDRSGFVPGEAIVFSAEVDNKSNRKMNASFGRLIMQVRYLTPRKCKVVNNILFDVKHGKIEGGETDNYQDKLYIPPVPPSYLQGCSIIDIHYFATLTVDPAGPGFDLNVPVEVVIGNIPLRHIAQQHGMNLPEYPAPPPGMEPPPPGAPRGLYSDSQMPQGMPPPQYAESAFGRVNTKDDEDNEHTSGQTEYAPMYTYYNWDKPNNNFAVKMDEG